jgi:hypothetical protein
MSIDSNQSTPEFDDFVASGEVEVGKSAGTEEEKPVKRGPPREAPKPAEKAPAAAEDDDEAAEESDDTGEEDEGEEEESSDKPKKSAKDHQIERLKREKADLNRRLRALEGGAGSAALQARIDALESRLTGGNGGDTKTAGKPEPDPTDTAKYPLGHLDDRYIEDKLEWLADQKAAQQADAVLQRQQENERNEAVSRQQTELLEKVDDLSAKGSELFEDFQESVVEAGMRGDWDLSQATFEACHDAENGAQILYNLANDPKEARRVAKLSSYQQLKYVQEKDAEIGTGKRGRTKPKAGEPPKNTARGANSRTQINPATDDLGEFEKAWEADAKRNS